MKTCSNTIVYFFIAFLFPIYVFRSVWTAGTAGFYEGQYNYPVIF